MYIFYCSTLAQYIITERYFNSYMLVLKEIEFGFTCISI